MLTRIVKAAHVLPHGNSDVDSGKRDFKKQQNVKNWKEQIVRGDNGFQTTKDIIKLSYSQLHRPERIPVTKKIIILLDLHNQSTERNVKKEEKK